MQSIIGSARFWDNHIESFKDGDLELDDYKAKIIYPDGSTTEIEIPEYIEYIVEVEKKSNFLVKVKRDEDFIAFRFYLLSDRNKKLEVIMEHYEHLNNRLKNRQNDFLIQINNKVEIFSNQADIQQLVYNFVVKTNRFLFVDFQNLICFERFLFLNYPLGKLSLQLNKKIYEHLLTFNVINEGFEEDVDVNILVEYYDEYFTKLVNILDKRLNFDTENEGIYVTWKLLLKEVCHYYYDIFNDEYGSYINDVGNLSLHECIRSYTNIDLIDINSISNASILTYYLMYLEKFEDSDNYLVCNNILVNNLLEIKKEKELNSFESSLFEETAKDTEFTIDDIDFMTGHEFEHFVSRLFNKMGYSSEVTKGSGDQGIDVIVEKNGRKMGVQTKCYSSGVTNKAIQEVVAGLKHYNLSKGIVVTNNYFTESAKELAISNDIILWDRNILKEKISEVF